MTNETDTIVHDWFELVWNQQRQDEIARLLAPDADLHGLKDLEGNHVRGPAGFLPLYNAFRDAFPNIHVDIQQCIRDGDMIAFRCVVRGTHRGSGLRIEPTGREIEFPGMGFVRVEGDKIAEAWNVFDFQSLYAQLS